MKNILPNLWKLIPKSGLTILTLLIITANSGHAQDITTDLVTKWTFNESPDDDDGVFGTATVVGATLTTDRLGRVDSAYSFDGVNDYIEIADNNLLDFDTDGDLSVALWFRAEQASTLRVLFNKGDGGSRYLGRLMTNGVIQFNLDYAGQFHLAVTTERYDDGSWHHVAFVLDRTGDQSLYVDGLLVASNTPTTVGTLTNSSPLRFGSLTGAVPQYMKGELDDIYIYSRALSQADVTALSTIGKPTFLGLVAQSPAPNSLDNGQASIISFDFDKDVDTGATIDVVGSLSGYVSGTTTIAGSNLTFDPTKDLKYGEKITVTLGDKVSALDGDTLNSSFTYQFRVKPNLSPEFPNTLFASDSTIDNFVNGNPSLAAADFDNDGDMDIVGTSGGEGKVTWYENDGSGVFSNQTNITTAFTDSYDIATGDMNNDGLMDVFVSYDAQISWFKNLGSGTFSTENLIGASIGARYLHIADMNNDGFIDLVNSQYFTEKNISVYYNNGNETFSANKSVVTLSSINQQLFSLEIADINNDSQLDIVYADRTGIVYHPNSGNKAFGSAVTLASFPQTGSAIIPTGSSMGLSVDDMDGDGDNDLVVGTFEPTGQASNKSQVVWFENLGSGSFSSIKTIDVLGAGSQTNSLEINVNTEDVDGDGDIDVLLFAKTGKLSWYENFGAGSFSERRQIADITPGQIRLNRPQAYDLTGDGALEIVAAGGGQLRYFNNADILSVVSYSPMQDQIDVSLDASISVTFDKELDESTITTNNVIVNGTKSSNLTGFTSMSYANKILTIDFTKDFISGEEISLILRNLTAVDGSGFSNDTLTFNTFETRVLMSYPSSGTLASATDSIAIKYNSVLDASTVNSSSLKVYSAVRGTIEGTYELYEDSTIIFRPSEPFLYGEELSANTTTQLQANGAGVGDLLLLQFVIKSLPADNPLSFTTNSFDYATSNSLAEIHFADLDSDGDLDAFYSDYGAEELGWLENQNGFGSFSNHQSIKQQQDFSVRATASADFNGDGKLDVLASSESPSFGDLLIGYYTRNTSTDSWDSQDELTSFRDPGTNGIRGMVASDFNLDGKIDLFTAANDLYLGELKVATDGSINQSGSFNLGIELFDVKVGDINGDNLPDMVVAGFEGSLWIEHSLIMNPDNFSLAKVNSINLDNAQALKINLCDIDQDGDLDVVQTGGSSSFITINLNDGNGNFTSQLVPLSTTFNWHLRTGDIEGDGDIDIVYSSTTSNRVQLLVNDGNLGFTERTVLYITRPIGIDMQDVDEDGDLDIIATSSTPGGSIFLAKNLTIDNNLPPGIINPLPTFSMEEDAGTTALIEDLSTVFSDPESDAITYMVSSSATELSVQLVNDTAVTITPAADFFGEVQVTITATDTNGGATDMVVAVTVTSVNDSPQVINPLLALSVNEDQGQITVNLANMFSDVEGEMLTYSFTNTNGAIDVSLDEANQRLVIDFIADANGEGVLTVIATDADNATATNEIQVTVAPVNDAPILSIADITIEEDFSTQQIAVLGISQPANEADQTVTVSVSPYPATIDWAVINFDETTATFTVDAVANSFGSQVFTIAADDGQSANNITSTDITIEVSAVNDAPNFELSTNQLTLGQDFSGTETITLTDLSPANETESIMYSLSPASVTFANVVIDASSGEISVTAVIGEAGSQVFTITADDGSATASDQLTIEILSNQAPVIVNAVMDVTYAEDAGVQVAVSDFTTLFDDPDGDDLSYTIASDNADIEVSLVGNTIEIVSSADYFGLGEITFTASDQTLATDLIFNVEITAVNDAPFVANAVADQESLEDANFSYQLPENVFDDVDGDNLGLIVAGVPDWMSFDGLSRFFTASPTNDEVGVYTISLEATDGILSATDEFTITIENVNDAPTVTNTIADQTLQEDSAPISLDLSSAFEDVDGDVLTYTLVSSVVDAASSVISGSSLSITPLADASGAGHIQVAATDGVLSASHTFSVTITAVNDAPTFTLSETAISVEANFTTQIITVTPDLVPSDEIDQVVTYSLSPATVDFATITIDAITGEVTIASIADESGQATVTVVADDGQSENNTFEASFDLTVAQVLSANDNLSEGVKIYPNPVADYIMIENDELVNLRFFGLNGQLIKEIDQVNGKVDLSTLPKGTYLMEIFTNDERATVRIQKTN